MLDSLATTIFLLLNGDPITTSTYVGRAIIVIGALLPAFWVTD